MHAKAAASLQVTNNDMLDVILGGWQSQRLVADSDRRQDELRTCNARLTREARIK